MFIYRLFHLDTPDITTYVGQTRKTLLRRLTIHKYDARNQKKTNLLGKWIREVNYKVGIELVEEVMSSFDDLDKREIYWIAEYSKMFKLLNILKGGRNAKNGALFGSKNGNSKKILQYDLNGDFIKEWDSIIEASKDLNVSYKKISDCVRLSNKVKATRSGAGYIWRLYQKDYPLKVESKIDRQNAIKKTYINNYGCKIKQYDLQNNLIKIWNSMHEINRELGFNRQGIYYALKHSGIVYGFRWEKVEEHFRKKGLLF